MKLDGSYGEGGGQILRTSVALSAVTGKPVEIENIRRNRPKPGLSAQHVKAVENAALICDAKINGCSLRSTHLSFSPGKIKGGTYEIDIGTAGSITLLMQCLMPFGLCATLKLRILGGTDVKWSPSIDYLRFVTLPALFTMGYGYDIRLLRRGYYPRGDGCIEAILDRSILKKTKFECNTCRIIEGRSHSSRLPLHVTQRQAASAAMKLREKGYESKIAIERNDFLSTGCGITLWCGAMGGCSPGEPGKKAEIVGSEAAEAILLDMISGAGVDEYLSDQLIPYIALAGGGTFTTRKITGHTRTNIWVAEQFMDIKFRIEKIDAELFRVSL